MTRGLLLGAILLGIAGFAACGGEDECTRIGKRVCAEACACGEGPTCVSVVGTGTAAEVIVYEDLDDCEVVYRIACITPSEAPGRDLSVCEAALDAPMCVDTEEDGRGLARPATCD